VARAKRTERADSRRRYRAATAGAPDVDAAGLPVVPAAAVPRDQRDRRPSGSAAGAPPPPRPSFLTSLRAAAGPADIRGDLRALPSIVLHSKAALVPGAVVLGTTAVMMIPSLAANQLVVLAGTTILTPPPMILAFLAGMLAPRGAWLMGGLAGLAAGLAYVLVGSLNTGAIMTELGFTYVMSADQLLAVAQNVLITSPVFGIAVGAFAGFYRRFLNMSAPQRQAGRKR
jgi:hypothetical protein